MDGNSKKQQAAAGELGDIQLAEGVRPSQAGMEDAQECEAQLTSMTPAAAADGDAMAQAALAFCAELIHRRRARSMSQRDLAGRMGYDRSYVNHIESGRYAPTEDFSRLAEEVLAAGGEIWGRWLDYHQTRALLKPPRQLPPPLRSVPTAQPAADTSRATGPEDEQATDENCAGAPGEGHQLIDLRGAQCIQLGANSTQYNTF